MRLVITKPKRFLSSVAGFITVIILIIFMVQFFRVSTINVRGGIRHTQGEIREKSGIKIGRHMWGVNAAEAAKSLEAADAYLIPTVEKHYPSTVEIIIAEREARSAMLFLSMGAWIVLDSDGRALETLHDESELLGLIRVTGIITTSSPELGKIIEAQDELQMDAYKSVLAAVDELDVSDIVYELNIANLDNMYLILTDNLTVMLGDRENLSDKFRWMVTGKAEIESGRYPVGILDVSSAENVVYVPYSDAEANPGVQTGVDDSPYGADKYPLDDIDVLVDWDNWS